MVESEVKKSKKGGKMRWIWLIGAFTAVVIAIALALINTPKISLKFGHINKSCHCSQDKHRYSGVVEDCCCDYETVDHLNEEVLNPLLEELVKTPFFRYFKVKLWCDCPFWPDDGMCRLRDCSVCECPESEFPESFKMAYHHGLPSDDLKCQEGKPQAAVDRRLDSKAFRGWTETDNPWTHDDETDNCEPEFVLDSSDIFESFLPDFMYWMLLSSLCMSLRMVVKLMLCYKLRFSVALLAMLVMMRLAARMALF